jgi:hypothetical protein
LKIARNYHVTEARATQLIKVVDGNVEFADAKEIAKKALKKLL